MALRLIKSQGTGSPFSSLAVIQSSDLLCSFPKQICRIYGSRLPKRWERGFHTLVLTFKTKNNGNQRNNCADERTMGRRADYERADTKYETNERRRNHTMPNCEYLLITRPDGTQIQIGQGFHSTDSISHGQILPLSQNAIKEQAPEENAPTTMSNRQLVIMSEALLDVSLSSQFTNIKALARFISKVSGRSEGSIRTCINHGIDYDNAFVKNDVEAVASLLDAIKPDVAEMLRKNIE